MNMKLHIALAVFILGMYAQLAFRQNSTDKEFVTKALISNQFEIALVDYATPRLSELAIKTYSKKVLDDHYEIYDELEAYAISKQWTVPLADSQAPQRMLDSLKNMSDESFDHMFLQLIIDTHQDAIRLFAESLINDDISDVSLKQWISEQLPSLRAHVARATDLSQKTKQQS